MYEHKTLVVFGVSQDPSKYGNKIFKTLVSKGFRVFGVNPKGGTAAGEKLWPELAAVPAQAKVAIMVIPPAALEEAVRQCIACGVKEIWFQPGAQSPRAYELAASAGIEAVDACFMAENGLW